MSEILSLESLPIPDNDIRVTILDYLYHREVIQVIINNIIYWVRFGVASGEHDICLQISVHNDNFSQVLASFGMYCYEKALREYRNLVKNISNNSWDGIFRNSDEQTNYYRLYNYCSPYTIMSELREKRDTEEYEVTVYCITAQDIQNTYIKNNRITTYNWKSVFGTYHYYPLKTALNELKRLHQSTQITSLPGIPASCLGSCFLNECVHADSWGILPSRDKMIKEFAVTKFSHDVIGIILEYRHTRFWNFHYVTKIENTNSVSRI